MCGETVIDQQKGTKFYIELDQLVVTGEGLFYRMDENTPLVKIQAVFHDEKGYYTKALGGRCRLGHKQDCDICEGCGVWGCPYECLCY